MAEINNIDQQEKNIITPKVFLSYSWSSKEHEDWVLKLANDLVAFGIDIVFDKWDLIEGADKFKYMEKMVTDKEIQKVIIVSDKIYSEKADERIGGVGTETQIISTEFYNNLDPAGKEQKFAAVVTEINDKGEPYLPTYLRARKYFNFTNDDNYYDNLEKLTRWLFNKPLFKKPEIGKTPLFITEENAKILGTNSRYKHAMSSLIKNKETAIISCNDYFTFFSESIENLRIDLEANKEVDDQVVQGIDSLLPYRDEFVDVVFKISKNYDSLEFYDGIHKFLEQIIPYAYEPKGLQTFNIWALEPFKFMISEFFLYTIAALLKNDRFEQINYLLEHEYYVEPGSQGIEGGMYPFGIFRQYLASLENRKQRLKLNRLSIMADLIKQRAKRKDISFIDIMQTDFILYLRSEMIAGLANWFRWYPYSLSYAGYQSSKFEKFLRSESKKYFDKFKIVLGINSIDQLKNIMEEFQNGKRKAISFDYHSINPGYMANIDQLAIKP